MTIHLVPPNNSGRELNAINRPSPIATDGTAIGRWKTASMTRLNHRGVSFAASAAQVPSTSATAPAINAVCRLTDRLARFSPDNASPKWPNPRFDGSASVHEPARPAITTVASGAMNTTSTTTAKPRRTTSLLRLLHNNIGLPLPSTAHQPREDHPVSRVQSKRQCDLHGGDHGRAGQVERHDAAGVDQHRQRDDTLGAGEQHDPE